MLKRVFSVVVLTLTLSAAVAWAQGPIPDPSNVGDVKQGPIPDPSNVGDLK